MRTELDDRDATDVDELIGDCFTVVLSEVFISRCVAILVDCSLD